MPEARCEQHQQQIHSLELKLTKIEGTVDHIKEKIDNGLTGNVTEILNRINLIVPTVDDNKFWVGKMKWGVFWIALVVVAGGVARVLLKL